MIESERLFRDRYHQLHPDSLIQYPGTFPLLWGNRWEDRWFQYNPDFYDMHTREFIEVSSTITGNVHSSAARIYAFMESYPHLRIRLYHPDLTPIDIDYVRYYARRDKITVKPLGKERTFVFSCLACLHPAVIRLLGGRRPHPSAFAKHHCRPETLIRLAKRLLDCYSIEKIGSLVLKTDRFAPCRIDLEDIIFEFRKIRKWKSGFEIVDRNAEITEARRLYAKGFSVEGLAKKYQVDYEEIIIRVVRGVTGASRPPLW